MMKLFNIFLFLTLPLLSKAASLRGPLGAEPVTILRELNSEANLPEGRAVTKSDAYTLPQMKAPFNVHGRNLLDEDDIVCGTLMCCLKACVWADDYGYVTACCPLTATSEDDCGIYTC